jgi:hypothetical protein
MNGRETSSDPPQGFDMAHPYMPTQDGFERRLRAWVRLPTEDVPTPDPEEASAPPTEPGVSASARWERRSGT